MNKSILIILFSTLFWLLLLEWGSSLYIKKWGEPSLQARQLLVKDPLLFWRQRPHLDTEFIGHPVVTNAQGFREISSKDFFENEGSRILLLGPSSAFGWGVGRDETYAKIVQSRIPNGKVFNASQIGYSFAQGALLYQQNFIDKGFNDIILAYGINDLDHFRFYYHDFKSDLEKFKSMGQGSGEVAKDSWAEKLSLINLAQFLSGRIGEKVGCGLSQMPRRRLSKDDILKQLKTFYNLASNQGARLILLGTPYQFQPNLDVNTLKHYEESVKAQNKGDCDLANAELEKAKSSEFQRIANDVKELNLLLKNWAHRNSVKFVDIDSLLIDKDDYVDPVHPSAKGHLKIANEMARVVEW